MIKVLALDQSSTATGWAVGSPDLPKPLYGVWKHPPLPADGDETVIFADLRKRLHAAMMEHRPSHLFFEEPQKLPHDSRSVLIRLYGMVGIIMMEAHDFGVPAAMIEIDGWRARFTGNKRAPPGLTAKHVRRKWWKQRVRDCCEMRGWPVSNNDEADALGILDFGLCCVDRGYASRTDPLMRKAQSQVDTIWRTGT